jgi:hypothetical protein
VENNQRPPFSQESRRSSTVWFFSFVSWDGQIRPILTVGVFASDGSIFGIKCSKADG